MGASLVAFRSLWLLGVAVSLAACGDGSEATGGTGALGGGGGSTSSGGAGTSSGGAGTGGSSSGNGGASSANLYAEPAEIVGGACTASPTAVAPPCIDPAEQVYCRLSDPSDVIMAACPAYGLEQCEVMEDCAPGWHACTATDYVARGGRDIAPDLSSATDRAWLAACVQDLGNSQFRNEPCSYCGDTDFEPVVEWWCDGEIVYEGGMAGTTLGVLAAPECMRVGNNLPSHGAYWGMAFTTDAPSFVMCCLDAL